MSEIAELLPETLADATRILTLGKALSPAQSATLAVRDGGGLVIGEIGGTSPFVVTGDAEGRIGNDRPAGLTQDAPSLHAAVLAARADARAVVLIRSPRLAAWGLAGRALPVRYFQMFGYTRATEIPVAKPNAAAVQTALAEHPDTPALLLTDGRVLVWAQAAQRAVRLVLSLEEAAQVTALADHLGGARDYPVEAREKIYLSLQAQTRR